MLHGAVPDAGVPENRVAGLVELQVQVRRDDRLGHRVAVVDPVHDLLTFSKAFRNGNLTEFAIPNRKQDGGATG